MKIKTTSSLLAGAVHALIPPLAVGAAIAVSGSVPDAATIYECRAYNGSSFYARDPCSPHNAIGVLNHRVPEGMPFDQ